MSSGISLIFKRAADETTHNNGCGPWPKMLDGPAIQY